MAEDDQEYRMGELRGDVNAIRQQLEKIEGKIDSTHSTHAEGYDYLEKRIRSLERFRAWSLGALAVIGGLVSVVLALARAFAADLLP